MEENLQVAGIYSFTVYNADRGAERYTYQWLDKEYREVLIAVEDRTVEMEKDPLTDYLNRDGFVRKTENILKKNADRYQFAIIYFNIRKFSGLNDVYGYENGDRIIRSYMDRIQNSTLRPLALGRVAADRFQALVDAKNLEPAALGKLLQYQVKIGEEHILASMHSGLTTPSLITVYTISTITDTLQVLLSPALIFIRSCTAAFSMTT